MSAGVREILIYEERGILRERGRERAREREYGVAPI